MLRKVPFAARAAYVAIVLIATLSDLNFSGDLEAASERFARAFTFSLGWRDAVDGLRNVALFAGLGGVWVATAPPGGDRQAVLRSTLVGLAISLAVEGLQCFSPVRTASFVDVSTNVLGALCGALTVAMLSAALVRAKSARSYFGVPVFVIGGAYGLAVLCESLTPLFNSEQVKNIWGGPRSRLIGVLHLAFPLTWSAVPWSDIPLFAPAGFLAVMLLAELGWRSPLRWLGVAIVGAMLLIATHAFHGAAGLPVRWEAAATDALAVSLGAWAADRWLPALTQSLRGSARARAALGGYAALLAFWGWRPLVPETRVSVMLSQLSGERFIPLASLAARVDLFSAIHVLQQFLLYLPLGALLAVWPVQLTGRWSRLTPAIALAVVIEVGHIVIAARFFDVTNALIACAGLGIGWIVVRRAGFTPYGEAFPRRPPATATVD